MNDHTGAADNPTSYADNPTSYADNPTGVRSSAHTFWAWGRGQAIAHPVALPFTVAIALRIAAAVVITIFRHGYLFPDESDYVGFGRLAAAGQLTPLIDHGYAEVLFHSAASFMWPIVVLFKIFGPRVVVAAMWAALFGAVTASLVAVLVGRILSPGWASLAGLAVAVFPSQVLWSSVVLRESMVWAALAGAALGVAGFARAARWPGVVACTVLVGTSLLALAFLRAWAFVAAAWAVAIAVWLFRPARPLPARSACLVLCVLVPVAAGLGLAGSTYVSRNTAQLGYERTVLSERAKSAFVHPKVAKAPSKLAKEPSKVAKEPSKVAKAPSKRSTTVDTIPAALSDEELVVPTGIGNDLRALPTGLVAFLLRPFPGQHGEGLSYDLAGLEELVYYPVYVLAIIGLVAYRRRREVIAFPFVVVVLVGGIAAEAEGNLGSAFRHRDQLLWAMIIFAALGAHHIYSRVRSRKSQSRATETAAPRSAARLRQEPMVHA